MTNRMLRMKFDDDASCARKLALKQVVGGSLTPDGRRTAWQNSSDSRLQLQPERDKPKWDALSPNLTPEEGKLLGAMRPATCELLAARALLRRTDTKFIFARHQLEFVLRAMRNHFDLVRSGDALVATYQTLYFDTGNLQFFHDHRRGRRSRQKVRIRNYVERGVGCLEIKTKDKYNVTSKVRRPHVFADFQLSDDDDHFVRGEVGGLSVEPSMDVHFPRLTLVCRDVNERITFDLGLSFRWKDARIDLPDVVVGEIKQEQFRARSPGLLALRARHIRPNRLSKYCVAMSLLRDGLPVHRFRESIRELRRHHNV